MIPKKETSESRKRRKKSKKSRAAALQNSKDGTQNSSNQVSFNLNTMMIVNPSRQSAIGGPSVNYSSSMKRKSAK